MTSIELVPTTYLELTAPPSGAPLVSPQVGLSVVREPMTVDDYLALYVAVGGPLGWDGHILMPRDTLAKLLASPLTALFILRIEGEPAGFCEFIAEDQPDAEIKYFGLVPAMQGRRLGPYLLDTAIRDYWFSQEPRRLWLHTDTWDSPKALKTYLRAGFRIFATRGFLATATHDDYRAAIGLTAKVLPPA